MQELHQSIILWCFCHVISAELGPEYLEVSQWDISILAQVAIHSHLPQAKLLNHSKHSCIKGKKKKEMSYMLFFGLGALIVLHMH